MDSPNSVPRRDLPALLATQLRLSVWIRSSSAPGADEAAEVVRGDGALPAHARLAVYANAWFVRIHRVLRDDFAATAALVGDAAFAETARRYLAGHPTTSPSLRDAGARFAEFLGLHPDAAPVRAAAPFAPDLAALEWALVEAFDAADSPELARADLAAVPPDGWAALRFATTPSVRLLRLGAPVHRVKQAADEGGEAAARDAAASIAPQSTPLRVWRRDERLFHRAIDAAEVAALEAVAAGEPFGSVCERVAGIVGEEEAAARSAACLEAWLADGVLAAIRA